MIQRYQTMVWALMVLCPILTFSQSTNYANLQVLNPQSRWVSFQGNVDQFDLTIKPGGLYTEVGVFMNISDRGSNLGAGTNLEAVMNFSLPEDVIVNDSWLWVNDTIIRAEIIDRWTATNIYEEIVDRNQDPSILYKNTARDYQLRIFPLPSTTFRRVKLNFLMPNDWTAEQVMTALPFHLANSSRSLPENPSIRVWVDDTWQNPGLLGDSRQWTYVEHPDLGTFYETNLSNYSRTKQYTIAFDTPMKDGVFLQSFENEDEGYYHLAFLPSKAFQLVGSASRDVLVLLHYNRTNARNNTVEDVLQVARQNLKEYLQPSDRFNIITADFDPQALSSDWLPATAQTIDSVFNRLSGSDIANYNLPGLLAEGIKLMKSSENAGRIMLFANSDQEGDIEISNQLLDDLRELMGEQVVPFYITDFQDRNHKQYWANNRRFNGNEYLYTNLSLLTQGAHESLFTCCRTLDEITDNLFEEAMARIGTMDLYTTLQNGFCYNRYNLFDSGEFVNLDKPILQIGKYKGDFPFVVEAAGEYNDEVYLDALSVAKSETKLGDINTQIGWTGNYLQQLEKEASPNGFFSGSMDNKIVAEVIDRSLSERILSLYTAFIALEPRLGGEPCVTCQDESGVTVNTENKLLDSLLQVEILPNPFRERVNINIQFRSAQETADYQFSVFNNVGQEIKRFEIGSTVKSQQLSLEWDGTNFNHADSPAGIYHFVIQSPAGRHTVKLVKY